MQKPRVNKSKMPSKESVHIDMKIEEVYGKLDNTEHSREANNRNQDYYSNLESVQKLQLETIKLNTLKDLYDNKPSNQECLLYLLKNRSGDLTGFFQDVYRLPDFNNMQGGKTEGGESIDTMKDIIRNPFDELFIWSLMLYSGQQKEFDLMKYYWSRTNHPMACCLTAMILYNRLQKKHFVPYELKIKLDELTRKFEKMATDVLLRCDQKENMITQDLLLRKIDMFFDRTCIKIALKARAYDFVATSAVQDTITDIWYERINPDLLNWWILLCLVLWPAVLFHQKIRLFRKKFVGKPKNRNAIAPIDAESTKNYNEVPNRNLKFRLAVEDSNIFFKIFAFLDAPLIKFIYHFVFYILFLVLYFGFILFDYYPVAGMYPVNMTETTVVTKFNVLKITVTEVILITWVLMFQMDSLRKFYQMKSPHGCFINKIRKYFSEDFWNGYDVVAYLVFYTAIIVRFIPTTNNNNCIFSTESCYEAARVIYCLALVLWFVKTLKFLVVLSFWGPKLMIIARMIKQLLVFVVLLFLFIAPFGASFQSIMKKTSPVVNDTSIARVLTGGFHRAYWPIFGEVGGVLDEIEENICPKGNCSYGLNSFFLYIGLAIYVIICNLLILNMIIAIFGATVDETQSMSMKLYKFQRYSVVRTCYYNTITPAPLIIFEFIVLLLKWIFTRCKKNNLRTNNFAIDFNPIAESEYNNLEKTHLDCYLKDAQEESASAAESTSALVNKLKETDKKIQSLTSLIEQNDKSHNEKLKSIQLSIDKLHKTHKYAASKNT